MAVASAVVSFKTPGGVTVINSTISGNSSVRWRWRNRDLVWGRDYRKQYYQRQLGRRCGRRHRQLLEGFKHNSTISGNSLARWGGISAPVLTNSTISGNSASSGGGIYNVAGQFA